jgi:hypothetical protein
MMAELDNVERGVQHDLVEARRLIDEYKREVVITDAEAATWEAQMAERMARLGIVA